MQLASSTANIKAVRRLLHIRAGAPLLATLATKKKTKKATRLHEEAMLLVQDAIIVGRETRGRGEEQVAVKHGRRLTVKGNASGRHCLHAARQTDTTVAMLRRIGLDACLCMYV